MKNLPKSIYLQVDEEIYETHDDFFSIKDLEAVVWSTRDMNEQGLRYALAKPYLGSTELIAKMQEHKKNIGKEKCTYGEGVLFGYYLGIGTENQSCGFDWDEEETKCGEIMVDNILTKGFKFCPYCGGELV